jgi:hypothetical protein
VSGELSEYRDFIAEEVEPTAAAILVLASRIDRLLDDELGHQIAMGVRKGLFGAAAGDHATIDETATIIANELNQQ